MYPELNPVQNGSTRPLETTVTINVSILGLSCTAELVEDTGFYCQRESCQATVIKNAEARVILTWVLP